MPISHNRRKALLAAFSILTASIAACRPADDKQEKTEKNSMKIFGSQPEFAYFNVSLFSYLDRPIFDVYLNKKDIGVASAFGGGGLMTGVKVPFGPQSVSWRLDGIDLHGNPLKDNGNTVHAVNSVVLDISASTYDYLGVHIYPDNTVELIPEKFWPDATERGLELRRQWKLKNGK